MDRHPLDANMRAADAHYGQDRPGDYDFCDRCGADFDDDTRQHPVMFMICEDCGDEMEGMMEERIGERIITCKNCEDGYAICVSDNQVWWVDYSERNAEMKAELAFSAIVEAIKICEATQ